MSKRVTRSMSRKLEKETKADIIKRISNLTPTERDILNVTFQKAAIRIQQAHRHLQNTRKKNQKKQKELKELKKNNPLHNKTLVDLPINEQYNEVDRICGIYGLNDNDVIKIIFTSIITSNTCNEFNMLLDNLFELNEKILEYIKESLSKIQELKDELNIFNERSNYGSSDDEEQVNRAIGFNTNNIMNEKEMITNTLLNLQVTSVKTSVTDLETSVTDLDLRVKSLELDYNNLDGVLPDFGNMGNKITLIIISWYSF